MVDLAERDGLMLDADRLSAELGVPVVPTIAVRKQGLDAVRACVTEALATPAKAGDSAAAARDAAQLRQEARRVAHAAIREERAVRRVTRRIDAVVLHPFVGPIILFATLFAMFQLV